MREKILRRYEIVILIAALLIYGCGQGILLNTLSVFIKPVSEDLRIPRSGLAAYASLVTAMSVISQPLYGRLYERGNLKKLMLIGAIVCAVVPIGYACSSYLWQFYLLALVQGAFINCTGIAAVGILINHWFLARKGVAIGIAYAGSGILGALMVSSCTKILAAYGWRAAYVLIGIAALGIFVPVIAGLVVDHPHDIGREPYGQAEGMRNSVLKEAISVSEVFRLRSFYCLCFANFFISIICQAMMGNSAAYMSDCGYSMEFQSAISSLLLLTMSMFKILIGQLMDKKGGLIGILTFGISGILAVLAMIGVDTRNPVFPIFMAVAMGAGGTGGHVVSSYLTLSYWGEKCYSQVYSLATVASMAGLAVGGPLANMFYDYTKSYKTAWYLMLVLAVLTVVLEVYAYCWEQKRKLK